MNSTTETNLSCVDEELLQLMMVLNPTHGKSYYQDNLIQAKNQLLKKELMPQVRSNHGNQPVTQVYDTCKSLLRQLSDQLSTRRQVASQPKMRLVGAGPVVSGLCTKYKLTEQQITAIPVDYPLYRAALGLPDTAGAVEIVQALRKRL